MLHDVVNEARRQPAFEPFVFPVKEKVAVDYLKIITRPMDLEKIRKNVTERKYLSRGQFLLDIDQIVDNAAIYNGETHFLAGQAKRLREFCVNLLLEKRKSFDSLEKMINNYDS